MAALPEPARPLLLGAGAAARLARDLRHRLPLRSRRLDHPALRDLHPIRCLYRPRPDRDDPAVQRDADLADDGSARIAALLGDPAARKLCQRDELRDFSDVLRILGTLSVVAGQGGEPPALLCLSG